ncbi:KICSTOR complex protein szt2, partial [Blyttiomyces sp. JEL0837]
MDASSYGVPEASIAGNSNVGMSGTTSPQQDYVEPQDLKAIALMMKNPAMYTRADHDKWILSKMMISLSVQDLLSDPDFQILDISTDVEIFPWAEDIPISIHDLEDLSSSITSAHKRTDWQSSAQQPSSEEEASNLMDNAGPFRITPQTKIYTLAKRYKTVLVVDVSASMRIVDAYRGKSRVLVSYIFELLCNCLDGISRRFTIHNSLTGHDQEIEPEVFATVLAEVQLSGFTKEQNPRALDFTSKYPIHVLLQDVQITSDNIFAVAERLADALNDYETDLIYLRQTDDTSVFSGKLKADPSAIKLVAGSAAASQVSFASAASFDISRAPTMAMEQAALNCLDYGYLALKLLPQDCQPVLILLIDGVTSCIRSGDFIYRDISRKLTRDGVLFTVIQAGSGDGFTPSVNFGHVADNEALRFLALVNSGKLIYGSDCHYLDLKTHGSAGSNQGDSKYPRVLNFYQKNLMMRITSLDKGSNPNPYRSINPGAERSVDLPRSRLLNPNVHTPLEITPEELKFPWDPKSQPPMSAEILCGYRDYSATTSIQFLIYSRLVEGFSLRSIQVSRKPGAKLGKTEVTLYRPWLPNVTILYTIKTRWSTFKSLEQSLEEAKSARIEINILANHAFAILFVNVPDMEEKSDYLVKLHTYLRGIAETDDLLKIVASFNTPQILMSIPRLDPKIFHFSGSVPTSGSSSWASGSNDSSSIWHALCQVMANKAASFNEWDRDLVVRSPLTGKYSQDLYLNTLAGGNSSRSTGRTLVDMQGKARLPSGLLQLVNFLAFSWCSLAVNRSTFVKFCGETNVNDDPNHVPYGFCMLRLAFETEFMVSIRMSFFNMDTKDRQRHIGRLLNAISDLQSSQTKRSDSDPLGQRSLFVCHKPIRKLMVRYKFTSNDDVETPTDMFLPGTQVIAADGKVLPPSVASKVDRSGTKAKMMPPLSFRSYLRTHRWIWLADAEFSSNVASSTNSTGRGNVEPGRAISELAFSRILEARIRDGFLLISAYPDSCTLYKEISVERKVRRLHPEGSEGEDRKDIQCGVQFVILLDRSTKTVITELWAEPAVVGPGISASPDPNNTANVNDLFEELYRRLVNKFIVEDRKIIERLYTFERIYHVGKERGGEAHLEINRRLEKPRTILGERELLNPPSVKNANDVGRKCLVMPTGYHLCSVLHQSSFATLFFYVPLLAHLEEHPEDPESKDPPPSPGVNEASPILNNRDEPDALSVVSDSYMSSRRSVTKSENPELRSVTAEIRSTTALDIQSMIGTENAKSIQSPQPEGGEAAIMRPILSTLAARERVGMTLHYYFEKALEVITDGQIPTGPINLPLALIHVQNERGDLVNNHYGRPATGIPSLKVEHSSILETIRDILEKKTAFGVDCLISTIRFSSCYVKVIDHDRFHLVFVPRYPSIDKDAGAKSHDLSKKRRIAFGVNMSAEERSRIRYLGVTIIQCERLENKAHSGSSSSENADDSMKWRLMVEPNAGEIGDEIASGSVVIEGISSSGGTADKSDTALLASDLTASKSWKADVDGSHMSATWSSVSLAYSSALSKTIYFSFLQGLKVETAVLERVISSCMETTLDIDISNYLNVLTLKNRHLSQSEIRYHHVEIQQQFSFILSQAFESVSHYASEPHPIYFFRNKSETSGQDGAKPPMTENERVSLDLDQADTPLFLRTECSFRKVKLSHAEHTHLPIKSLPTSYKVSSEGSPTGDLNADADEFSSLDFTPHLIGSKENPIESEDGTLAILHLACLTLPSLDRRHENDEPVTLDRRTEDPLGEQRISISPLQIHKVRELQSAICLFLDDEVMDGLLFLRNLTDEQQAFSVSLVHRLLSTRHERSIYPVDQDTAIATSVFLDSVSFTLDVALKFVFDNSEGSRLSFEEMKCTKVIGLDVRYYERSRLFRMRPSERSLKKQSSRMSGLGINVGDTAESKSQYELFSNIASGDKFWLMVEIIGSVARIHFFSRRCLREEKVELIENVLDAIFGISERANQLILLKKMSNSQRASKFMIPPHAGDSEDELDDTSSEDEVEDRRSASPLSTKRPADHAFSIGQFACPVVLRRQFSLHWRLRPQNVLNSVSASLTSFGLSNRRNMFVLNNPDGVFYLKLGVDGVETAEDSGTPPNRGSRADISISAASSGKESPKTPLSPGSRRGGALVQVATTQAQAQALGQRVAENILILEIYGVTTPSSGTINEFVAVIESKLNALTQNVVTTFLSRHVTIRLTRADVDFIVPTSKIPSHRHKYWVPHFVTNIQAFLSMFRQHLLTSFTALHGVDVSQCLKKHYENEFTLAADGPDTIQYLEVNEDDPDFVPNLNQIMDTWDSEFSGSDRGSYVILVEIWHHGTVTVEYLANHLSYALRSTVLDYILEATISTVTPALGISETDHISNVQDPDKFQALRRALEICSKERNQAVYELKSNVDPDPSISSSIACDIQQYLTETSRDLSPLFVTLSDNGKETIREDE